MSKNEWIGVSLFSLGLLTGWTMGFIAFGLH